MSRCNATCKKLQVNNQRAVERSLSLVDLLKDGPMGVLCMSSLKKRGQKRWREVSVTFWSALEGQTKEGHFSLGCGDPTFLNGMRTGTSLYLQGPLPDLDPVSSFLRCHCQTGLAATQSVSSAVKCVDWMCTVLSRVTLPTGILCILGMEDGRQWAMTDHLRYHQLLARGMLLLHLHLCFQTIIQTRPLQSRQQQSSRSLRQSRRPQGSLPQVLSFIPGSC